MWHELNSFFCWVLLAAVGATLGWLANALSDTLAWQPRGISPFAPRADGKTRRLVEYLPILGWVVRSKERDIEGRRIWLQLIFVELACAAGVPLLYGWEVSQLGLIPAGVPRPSSAVLHAVFIRHVVLIFFMLVASLIDWRERFIPDSVTIPGTWLALILAAAVPYSQLPVDASQRPFSLLDDDQAEPRYGFLIFSTPNEFPRKLGGQPHGTGLSLGLGCWWLWCFALMPRRWYRKRGFWQALKMMLARLCRSRVTGGLVVMGLVGSAGILFTWLAGGVYWQSLLSALVGMVASAMLAWMVRIVGSFVLGQEALGFGDVTLMGMIGAYLGWQPGLIVFFLAPFAGLLTAIIALIRHRETEIFYGPFLCLGALVTIIFWRPIWAFLWPVFGLGFLLPLVVLVLLIFMAPLLLVIRCIRRKITGIP